ncbi:hypothetical protein D3C71_1072410 [compost metagenome]
MDRVAVAQRVLQAAQHDNAGTAAKHRAAGPGIEGAAMPVRRQDGASLVAVAAFLQQIEPDAARKRHVALVAQQGMAGHVNGHQRGRAGGLHRDRGPAQVQLVRQARGQRVHRIAVHQPEQLRYVAAGADACGRQQVLHQVQVGTGSRVDADGAWRPLRIVARMLQRFPRALQKDALLRIEVLGLARREAEETCVELLGPF